jgi:very-short-patch-repair endonuclease
MQKRHPARPESPIEEQFWAAWQRRVPDIALELQYPACGGAYRLDFAHPPSRIAIELDGYTHHSSHARFTQDRKRHRDLVRDGWRVLVFSGTEVFHQADRSVDEARATIQQLSGVALAPPAVQPPALNPPFSIPPANPRLPTSDLRPPTSGRRPLYRALIIGLAVAVVLGLGLAARIGRRGDQAGAIATGVPSSAPTARSWVVAPTPTLAVEPPLPAAPVVAPTSTAAVLRTAAVQSPELNVRDQPGLDGPVVTRIKQGAAVEVLAEQTLDQTTWAQVRFSQDGALVVGWVNGGYLR